MYIIDKIEEEDENAEAIQQLETKTNKTIGSMTKEIDKIEKQLSAVLFDLSTLKNEFSILNEPNDNDKRSYVDTKPMSRFSGGMTKMRDYN